MNDAKELGISLKSITDALTRCTKAKRLFVETSALASSSDVADADLISAKHSLHQNLRAEAGRLHERVEALLTAIDELTFGDDDLAVTIFDIDEEA